MSGKNNVNPDHYKTAGRDRQGEDILHEDEKRDAVRAKGSGKGPGGAKPNFIPGKPPAGESEPDEDAPA